MFIYCLIYKQTTKNKKNSSKNRPNYRHNSLYDWLTISTRNRSKRDESKRKCEWLWLNSSRCVIVVVVLSFMFCSSNSLSCNKFMPHKRWRINFVLFCPTAATTTTMRNMKIYYSKPVIIITINVSTHTSVSRGDRRTPTPLPQIMTEQTSLNTYRFDFLQFQYRFICVACLFVVFVLDTFRVAIRFMWKFWE